MLVNFAFLFSNPIVFAKHKIFVKEVKKKEKTKYTVDIWIVLWNRRFIKLCFAKPERKVLSHPFKKRA